MIERDSESGIHPLWHIASRTDVAHRLTRVLASISKPADPRWCRQDHRLHQWRRERFQSAHGFAVGSRRRGHPVYYMSAEIYRAQVASVRVFRSDYLAARCDHPRSQGNALPANRRNPQSPAQIRPRRDPAVSAPRNPIPANPSYLVLRDR